MNINTEKKLTKFVINELSTALSNVFLFKDKQTNEYWLFNRYYITETSPGIFQVSFTYNDNKQMFNSLKNAMCYCIFDNANKFNETMVIKNLDTLQGGIDVSIYQLKSLIEKTKDFDSKMIFVAKLNEELLRKKRIKIQIDKFIAKAKDLQSNRFKERNPNK